MSLIRKHGAVLQAWACLALVFISVAFVHRISKKLCQCYFFK